MNQLYYLKNDLYDYKAIIPRTINVIPYSDSIHKYSAKGTYYNLFKDNWIDYFSTRHIRANLKNNAYPCIDLGTLYSKLHSKPNMYAQGKVIGTLIKNTPIVFYTSNKFIHQIPPHIVLAHLSQWTGVSVPKLTDSIAKSTIKIIYRLGLNQSQICKLNDLDLKII